jgi:DNA topoisomerase-1
MLSREQLGIYTLIWERAIASQCKPAKLARTEIEILAGPTRWVARGMRTLDPGYLRFWKNTQEDRELPKLQEGQTLGLQGIDVKKGVTEPPSRYSEPKAIQLMEKLGIGRPSTYASTILTLKEREYVYLEKGLLAPTPLGMATDEALGKAIPELVDAKFTAEMELSLDQIAEGKLNWERYLCTWNESYLRPALVKAKAALVGVRRVSSEKPVAKKGFHPKRRRQNFRQRKPQSS